MDPVMFRPQGFQSGQPATRPVGTLALQSKKPEFSAGTAKIAEDLAGSVGILGFILGYPFLHVWIHTRERPTLREKQNRGIVSRGSGRWQLPRREEQRRGFVSSGQLLLDLPYSARRRRGLVPGKASRKK